MCIKPLICEATAEIWPKITFPANPITWPAHAQDAISHDAHSPLSRRKIWVDEGRWVGTSEYVCGPWAHREGSFPPSGEDLYSISLMVPQTYCYANLCITMIRCADSQIGGGETLPYPKIGIKTLISVIQTKYVYPRWSLAENCANWR